MPSREKMSHHHIMVFTFGSNAFKSELTYSAAVP